MQNKKCYIIAGLALFLSFQIAMSQSRGNYGSQQSTYQRDVSKYGSDNPYSSGLSNLQSELRVGRVLGAQIDKYRAFYQWDIPDTLVPAGSTIDTVQIQFSYYMEAGNHPLPVRFYSLSEGLVSPNLSTLWSGTESGAVAFATGNQNTINVTQSAGSPLVVAVGNALSLHRFVLGIRYEYETSYDSLWKITNSTVILRLTFTRPQHTVTIDQKVVSTSASIDSIDIWGGSSFLRYKAPKIASFFVGSDTTLRGTQKLLTGKKYNKWDGYSSVVNHTQFRIYSGTANIIAKVDTVQNATIQAKLVESSSPGGSINFQDPWLIDYADSYGLRNQGMSAPFKSVASSSNNIGTATNYKGVFQGLDPLQGASYYYSVNAPQTQPIVINGQSHTGVFQNWVASKATLQSSTNTTTPVVFTGSGATITANYKGIHISNDANAFSSNSQRKFNQTIVNNNRWLHQVYASAGLIWIEHSTDNGQTWTLGNNGKPLGAGKNPSISFSTRTDWGNNYIGVVWQQQSGPYGSRYSILGMLFNQISGTNGVPYSMSPVGTVLFDEPSDAWSTNANPDIIVNYFTYVITFERKSTSGGLQPGINWLVGSFYDYGSQAFGLNLPFNGLVAGTDANSTNAALSLNPYYSNLCNTDIDCVYQTPSGLRYLWLHYYYNGSIWEFTQQSPPSAIGYSGPVNINPSVVSFPQNGNFAASWIEYDQLAYCYSGNLSTIYYYDSGVQSCAMNRGGDNSGFAAWSQNNYGTWTNKSIRFQNYIPSSSTLQTLSTAGKYVQLANSVTSSLSNMYVSSFYSFSTPYSFATSGQLGPLNKGASEMVTGRGFVINKGDMSFTYRLEGLNVDGVNIGFVDASDTADYSNITNLNNVLITQPFEIESNSKVTFIERSGFADSTLAVKAFYKDGFIRYRIELIDEGTGKVIGTIKNVDLSSSNVQSLKMSSYSLASKGIASKMVRAKITLATNLAIESSSVQGSPTSNGSLSGLAAKRMAHRSMLRPQLILTKSYVDVNEAANLAKESLEELTLESVGIPIMYALEQNYPNPFNPSTTIKYQLAGSSVVTLKVYDMLGREVVTLVDGVKDAGYYTSTFNGAGLSSGIYLARLQATPQDRSTPFSRTMKMLMTK
jgi:hypothetical protein